MFKLTYQYSIFFSNLLTRLFIFEKLGDITSIRENGVESTYQDPCFFSSLFVSYVTTALIFSLQFIGAIMGARDLNIQTENGHIGMPTNICCVVVEYLPGGALKSFLIKNRRRKLAFKVVVQIALDLARGLVFYWVIPSLSASLSYCFLLIS
jgi:hypothetical protein